MPVQQDAEKKEVLDFLIHIIEDVVGIDLDEDLDLSTPVGQEGMDLESIAMMEVLTHVEREYDISVPDEAIEELLGGTIGKFVDEIMKCRTAVAAGAGAEKDGI